ncbi:hypothetical protein [Sporocytophaga myxococcoides]|uniref:hypothetical protein n=1 Tax=Sporocytophaga myxococcoides TaxID=153721 RepID=UPI000429ACD9|nr:hypothetical protein [Sporocytophaga myxococcoides]
MLKSKTLGRTFIIVGVVYLFRRVTGHYSCFGGYVDNSKEIIAISFVLLLSGIVMLVLKSKAIEK